MYMELTTVDEWTRRKRSSTEKCTREMNEPSCCLYSLQVNFERAGWDFIIAPKLYDAQMCSGECRLHHVSTFLIILVLNFRYHDEDEYFEANA
uniref:Growth/differentiation factor 11 n=1 Tax=Anisakis simplex TaxID=6269 RepID=A0A2R4KS95_ANISI|nr:Growth/differentiation factor 11 [Anisakis simplex]